MLKFFKVFKQSNSKQISQDFFLKQDNKTIYIKYKNSESMDKRDTILNYNHNYSYSYL